MSTPTAMPAVGQGEQSSRDFAIPHASVRVLYTLNDGPHFVLARHPPVPFALLPASNDPVKPGEAPRPRYGRVALRACLAAVRAASPEIFMDYTLDFSVYMVDPLERSPLPIPPIPGTAQDASQHEKPVMTGMGLMSWCFSVPDAIPTATGRMTTDGEHGQAIEVVLALYETRVPQEIHRSAWSNAGGSHAHSYSTGYMSGNHARATQPSRTSSRPGRGLTPPRSSSPASGPGKRKVITSKGPRPGLALPASTAPSTAVDNVIHQQLLNALIRMSSVDSATNPSESAQQSDKQMLDSLVKFLLGRPTEANLSTSSNAIMPASKSPIAQPVTASSTWPVPTQSSQQGSAFTTRPATWRPFASANANRASSKSDDDVIVLNKENVNPDSFRPSHGRKRSSTDASDDTGKGKKRPKHIPKDSSKMQSQNSQRSNPLASNSRRLPPITPLRTSHPSASTSPLFSPEGPSSPLFSSYLTSSVYASNMFTSSPVCGSNGPIPTFSDAFTGEKVAGKGSPSTTENKHVFPWVEGLPPSSPPPPSTPIAPSSPPPSSPLAGRSQPLPSTSYHDSGQESGEEITIDDFDFDEALQQADAEEGNPVGTEGTVDFEALIGLLNFVAPSDASQSEETVSRQTGIDDELKALFGGCLV